MPKMTSKEFFTLDKHGNATDAALHEMILDNMDADAVISKQAIERAIARGMSRGDAEHLYGIKRAGKS